jgi:hypothetical protein
MVSLRQMDESRHRSWDVILKVVGMVGIAVGAAFTYWQYFDGVKRQERTALIEAQKPFYAQRQQIYGDATRTVAQLATSSNPVELKKTEEAFWQLYWGPLASVESKEVATFMIQMGRCLHDTGCGKSEKQKISLGMAQQVRKESATSWGLQLFDADPRP